MASNPTNKRNRSALEIESPLPEGSKRFRMNERLGRRPVGRVEIEEENTQCPSSSPTLVGSTPSASPETSSLQNSTFDDVSDLSGLPPPGALFNQSTDTSSSDTDPLSSVSSSDGNSTDSDLETFSYIRGIMAHSSGPSTSASSSGSSSILSSLPPLILSTFSVSSLDPESDSGSDSSSSISSSNPSSSNSISNCSSSNSASDSSRSRSNSPPTYLASLLAHLPQNSPNGPSTQLTAQNLTELQSRITTFLPILQAANRTLETERAEGNLAERNIENVGEGEEAYIEMVSPYLILTSNHRRIRCISGFMVLQH